MAELVDALALSPNAVMRASSSLAAPTNKI